MKHNVLKEILLRLLTLLTLAIVLTSCSTVPRKRFLIGAGIGGAGGAVGGAVLSPNDESRGLNSLIFGLVGAIAGGVIGLLIHDDSEIPEAKPSAAKLPSGGPKEFQVEATDQTLPEFVKNRLQKITVEELPQPDTVSEDGTLHEPHKIYRIKRQAELFAQPIKPGTTQTIDGKDSK